MRDVMTAGQTDVAAAALAGAIADRLASPSNVRGLPLARGWWPQSMAHGAAGVALLHAERAHAGLAPWQRAHDWLTCAATGPVSAGDDSHLHYGAPALAFALLCAAGESHRYARALDGLDRHVAALTRRRLDLADGRIDRGELAALAEFDAIRGLAGIGAYLLRRAPDGHLVRAVLSYLVRLTEPVEHLDEVLPGWWTDLSPAGQHSERFPGGHANIGMAHGIAGPLALLSLAARRGVTVTGQFEAIGRICAWLDRWRQGCGTGYWWPYWITRAEHRAGQVNTWEPWRPSWCYGTAGLARAQQLAALATGDTALQGMAESAVVTAVADWMQLGAISDLSLCHGYAGLLHISGLVAADAMSPLPASHAPRLLDAILLDAPAMLLRRPVDVGLLEGAAGIGLALHAVGTGGRSLSGWNACLLVC